MILLKQVPSLVSFDSISFLYIIIIMYICIYGPHILHITILCFFIFYCHSSPSLNFPSSLWAKGVDFKNGVKLFFPITINLSQLLTYLVHDSIEQVCLLFDLVFTMCTPSQYCFTIARFIILSHLSDVHTISIS